MKKKEMSSDEIFNELLERYPALTVCRESILETHKMLTECYRNGGKLLIAGNGGSAADSEHIVGELMKSFRFNRRINHSFECEMKKQFGLEGQALTNKMEGTLSAIPLTSMPALTSAFSNDVDAAVGFAQMLYGYGNKGDVFIGITTSGNSRNILYALMTAKAKGIHSVALTGQTGGKARELCDVAICVPSESTFAIQEYHLPVYHALCAMLEADFFEEKESE
ncbi:MAG TPA: SIS domain-containing protein [Caproicibacter sp.]|nr:SIS domain-containing protein [Caproicibacter sp.]